MRSLGENHTEVALDKMLQEVDKNGDSEVNFNERIAACNIPNLDKFIFREKTSCIKKFDRRRVYTELGSGATTSNLSLHHAYHIVIAPSLKVENVAAEQLSIQLCVSNIKATFSRKNALNIQSYLNIGATHIHC